MTQFSLAPIAVGEDDRAMASRRILLPRELLKDLPAPAPVEPTIIVPDTEPHKVQPHLSYSQMSMYLRCSKQYYFRYVRGLKDRPKVSLSIGKGGHAALEYNTKTKLRTGQDAPVEAVLDKASDMMDHYLREMPESEYEKDVEPGSTKDKFIAATKVFRLRDAPLITPIGSEVEFNLDINEFLPEDDRLPEPIRIVNGKIDLVYDDTGVIVAPEAYNRVGIDDYKYVTRKKTQNEVNLSPQLTLYGLVLRKLTSKWPTRVGLRMIHPGTTKDAPDSISLQREAEHMTEQALERRSVRLAYQFKEVERAIRAEVFIPTDDPITCSWCGFRERCQSSLVNDYEAAKIRETTSR